MKFSYLTKIALAGVLVLGVSCGSKSSGSGSGSSSSEGEDSARQELEQLRDSLAQEQKLKDEAQAAAERAEADSIAAVEAAEKAEADAKAEKKAIGIVGEIKTSDGTVYTLKKGGRWTANKGYYKTGRWAKDGKVVDIIFDQADGNMFYYNGAIYELGSECDFNKNTMRGEDYEGNPISLAENKTCNATLEWF